MTDAPAMLKLDHVTVHNVAFPEPLLVDFSAAVERGGALALTGPTGCGKSTVLELLSGGLRPSAGTVAIAGLDPTGLAGPALAAYRQTIGYVPQRGALLSNLTLADNITLPLRYHRGATPVQAADALRRLMRLFEIENPPPVQAASASLVWRGIAALARALILDPALLAVDELGEDLDASDRGNLWQLLLRVRREWGLTVVAATTDPHAAGLLGGEVRELAGRRLVNFGVLRASSVLPGPYTAPAPPPPTTPT